MGGDSGFIGEGFEMREQGSRVRQYDGAGVSQCFDACGVWGLGSTGPGSWFRVQVLGLGFGV